jgi:hypothetical protein
MENDYSDRYHNNKITFSNGTIIKCSKNYNTHGITIETNSKKMTDLIGQAILTYLDEYTLLT